MVDSMLFPMLQEGRQAIPMDLSIGGPHMDLTTDVGFCNSLFMIANLKPGSGALAAPVCGSWIFMTGVPKKNTIFNVLLQLVRIFWVNIGVIYINK